MPAERRGAHSPNSARIAALWSPTRGAARVDRVADAVDADRRARGEDRDVVLARHGLQHVEGGEALAVEQFVPVEDPGAPDVGRLEHREPFVDGPGRDLPGDDRLDRVAGGEPGPGVAGIGRQLGLEAEQRRQLRDRRHGDGDVGVLRRIDAVGRRQVGMRAAHVGALRQAATVVEEGGQHLELEIDQRLEEAGLDVGALAGDAAPDQRGENALRRRGAGEHVADGEAERHRALALVAVQPHHARARLRQEILPRPLHPRAFLAVAADRGVDEARVDRTHRLPVDAEPLDDAGPEVLDHHVGLGDAGRAAPPGRPRP